MRTSKRWWARDDAASVLRALTRRRREEILNTTGYDAIVVGAGPVGQFLALAAGARGRRILVLEARANVAEGNNDRTLAVSHGSWLMLERFGVTAALAALATPIRSIHISQRGGPGRTALTAAENGLPALGYVVGYRDLQSALATALACIAEVRHGTAVTHVTESAGSVSVHAGDNEFNARDVIIAEGGGKLLAALGLEQSIKEYGVNALVARVTTDAPQRHIAYERFAAKGPMALLPRGTGFALVWTLEPAAALQVAAMPTPVFLQALQNAFGWRAGRFIDAGERGSFPLVLRRTSDSPFQRVTVLGNAAQTLHPVAGQGLNLGLRDAWVAADALVRDGRIDGRAFAIARRRDRGANVRFTDLLAELFTATAPGLEAARGFGLTLLDTAPGLRRLFTHALSIGSLR